MAESYDQAIRSARQRYRERQQESAADVLLIARVHRKPRATVCKDIAGEEGWNALDHAARALEKTAGQTADELRAAQAQRTQDRQNQAVWKAAKENPDFLVQAVKKVAPRAFEAALEPEPLAPVSGSSRQAVEGQRPGELLLMEFYGWYIRGKKLVDLAQESGQLNKRGREDLEDTAELVRTLVDLIVTCGTSGDFDEELAALLEERN